MGDSTIWWRIAWRNLWRNRRRTIITASALAFGFFVCVFMIGVADGIVQAMVQDGTKIITGQVQIHDPDYLPERSIYNTLGGAEGVDVGAYLERIRQTNGVRGAAPRVFGGGLLSSGEETVAAGLMGIDPVAEQDVSRILTSLIDGRVPALGERGVLIGDEMARKLGVGAGDELVVVVPAADGSMGNDLYTVSGVFRTGLPGLDAFQALAPIDVLQDIMVLDRSRIHEIGIDLEDVNAAATVADDVLATLGPLGEDVAAEPWTVFRRELYEYVSMAGAANSIIVFIIFAMAIFGVANTMIMATYERRKEFAVVRALGTTPRSVALTVVLEGVVLGAVALVVGTIITVPVMAWVHANPIDISAYAEEMRAAGSVMRPVIQVAYSVEGPLISAVGLMVTSLLAALFPAYRAVRIPPADALAGR